MTIIAAAFDASTGAAAMAADTLSWIDNIAVGAGPKVRRCGAALVGTSGSAMWARTLRGWRLTRDIARPLNADDVQAQLDILCDTLRTDTGRCGHGQAHNGEWMAPVSALVATSVGLWLVSGACIATVIVEPYAAVGAGQEVAYGALWAMSEYPIDQMVSGAVTAAIAHSNGCGGDTQVVSL